MSTTLLEIEQTDYQPALTVTRFYAGLNGGTRIELCIRAKGNYITFVLDKNEALTMAQKLIEAYKL